MYRRKLFRFSSIVTTVINLQVYLCLFLGNEWHERLPIEDAKFWDWFMGNYLPRWMWSAASCLVFTLPTLTHRSRQFGEFEKVSTAVSEARKCRCCRWWRRWRSWSSRGGELWGSFKAGGCCLVTMLFYLALMLCLDWHCIKQHWLCLVVMLCSEQA